MPVCFAPMCNHTTGRTDCKLFRFPFENSEEARIWKRNCKRGDKKPDANSRLCSCHFVGGDKNVPPTIFQWTKKSPKKSFSSPPKYKKRGLTGRKRRATVLEELDINVDIPVESIEVLDGIPQVLQEFSAPSTAEPISSGPSSAEVICKSDFGTQTDNLDFCVEFSPTNKNVHFCDQFTQTNDVTFSDQCTQTIRSVQLQAEIALLESEIDKLKAELKIMKEKKFRCSDIKDNQHLFAHYTGVPKSGFEVIIELCQNVKFQYLYHQEKEKNEKEENEKGKHKYQRPRKLSFRDEVLLTLMKLRLNLTNQDLAFRFGISVSSVSIIFRTILLVLNEILFKNLMNEIPSQLRNRESMPASFEKFRNCRIIIDCFEVPTETPEEFEMQNATYSNYKHHHTSKILLGIAPNGVATFVSEAYPGCTSDKNVVIGSRLMEKMNKGDLILADKGFILKDILPESVSLNIPPFLSNSGQFSETEVEETYRIASARIHVERAIRRIKTFRILDFIRRRNFRYLTEIVQTVVALTNFKKPLIKSVANHLGNYDYVTDDEDEDA